MAELVGEAAEQDETFWGDSIWQEAESDEDSFVEEEIKPDVFDSDFNDSETEEDSDSDDEKKVARRENTTGAVSDNVMHCAVQFLIFLHSKTNTKSHKR